MVKDLLKRYRIDANDPQNNIGSDLSKCDLLLRDVSQYLIAFLRGLEPYSPLLLATIW
jgi:hypothetical protein